ncbi:MAG TPA: DNA repair protein RecO [Phycisphaerae bacterium]|nr:DNA repair protein RecO [Phycisphaerae bacterium]
MAAIKDQAIVLRHLDYSETSQVLVLLTRDHGQQRLIGKGVKRSSKTRPAIAIDLLERGEVVFLPVVRAEAGLGTLTEWRQEQAYLGLRENLDRWYAGQYAAEITATMTEEADPHPQLFDALAGLLAGLCAGDDVTGSLVGYQRVVLEQAGLWPDFTRCVVCDRPAPENRAAYFSARQGGLACRICQPKLREFRKVDAETLTALREDRCGREKAGPALELLDYVIGHVIGRPTSLQKSPLV